MQTLAMFLAINGFIIVLCSLIALSSYLLRQSGKAKLQINDRPPEESECGQTLFTALAEKDIYLPAACGGKGTCGRCLVKCLQGGGPIGPLERILLDSDQLRAGYRLACQVKIRGDLMVELPPELLAAKKFPVRVIENSQAGAGICIIKMKILNNQTIEFMPGQYVQVYRQLPHENIVRAYSLSSSADDGSEISLDVQLVPGGLMSPWLHRLEPGNELEISGPYGEMAMNAENFSNPVVLVAGGVGLAPMRSILKRLVGLPDPPQTWLFWGARHRVQLYAEAELHELVGRLQGRLKFIPALSGDLVEEGWLGERGLIHMVLERHLPDLPQACAFICGPGPMMTAVTEVLLKKELRPENIKADPFDF